MEDFEDIAIFGQDASDLEVLKGIADYGLPKSIVQRIATKATDGALFTRESKELLVECATVFVSYVTAHTAQIMRETTTRKTLLPADVLRALVDCGMADAASTLVEKFSLGADSLLPPSKPKKKRQKVRTIA